MDELISYFERYVYICALGLAVFLVIRIIGFISGKFRSSNIKNTTSPAVDKNIPISKTDTIGDISDRIDYDVRYLLSAGYSDDQINGVIAGQYTVDELWKMKPEGREPHDN